MPALRASVVIPAFNAARTLEGLLFDLSIQTAQGFEVIVSDDGSCDDTAAVVRRHPTVRHVRSERRGGAAAARNRGLVAAGPAPVFLFVDADCRVFPTWVERHLEAHRRRPDELIAGPVRGLARGYFGQADVFASWYSMIPGRPSGPETEIHLLTPNLSVKRAAFERLGLFDEGLVMCEDAEFCFRAWRAGLRTYFDGANEILHRNRSGLRGALRHHFAFGPWALALRRHAPDMPYGRVIPRSLELAVLGAPFLAALHTAWLVRRWVRWRPQVLLYVPGLYVLKLAHAAGVAWAIAAGRDRSAPRVPSFTDRRRPG